MDEYESQDPEKPDFQWLEDLRTKLMNLGVTKQKVEQVRENYGNMLGNNHQHFIDVLLDALEKNEKNFDEQEEEIQEKNKKKSFYGPMDAQTIFQKNNDDYNSNDNYESEEITENSGRFGPRE